VRSVDVLALFDFSYWATRTLLTVASDLTPEEWTAPSDVTPRDLRATLVHALDVEWSWRLRLMRRPEEEWGPEAELKPSDHPTPAKLAEHWKRDEAEMREWLATLDDDTLERDIDLGGRDRFPLWYFLMHIVVHSQQQRSDAAVLLTRLGHSPGDVEFLNYADSTRAKPS
jgi:uncharacterized damage-inducible protein DinB